VSFHGADVGVDLHKPAYLAATKAMLAATRCVLVRSESLKKRGNRSRLPLRRRSKSSAPEFPLADFPFRPRSRSDNGQWRWLQAGRLIEKKGLKTTLRAFANSGKNFQPRDSPLPAKDRNSRIAIARPRT